MSSRPFEFSGAAGHRLTGRLQEPVTPARAWAIFAHCFTCGKDSLAAARVARELSRLGIGVLCFDFAGVGESGGSLADSAFASDVADLIAAGGAMEKAGMAPGLLVGHSLGGAAVLMAAGDMPSVRAVATIGAPADVAHVLRQFDAESLEKIEREGAAEVRLADRPFVVSRSFIEDARSHDLEARIAALHRPLLILHAPRDQTVGIDNATRIFLAARHPKSFVSLDDADHLLTRREDADYVARVICAWATRYLARPAVDSADEPACIIAEATGDGLFQVEIQAGAFRFLADEPSAVGGQDSGPSPYDLVSAGLAACTTMTMRLYANRKGWPLEGVRTCVGHSKPPGATPADLFSRTIWLEGPLDGEQRQRLLEIANKCPVDLTLERGSKVETSLSEAMPPAEPERAHAEALAAIVAGG
jgi:putative redox protein